MRLIGLVLRLLFYGVVVRLVVLFVLGLNVRHRERLPLKGPAIIAANHNSHLDAMVLATLLPLRLLPRIRPVAAADYFLRGGLRSWFATEVVGIVPIRRQRTQPDEDLLAPVQAALERLAERCPDVPVIPVFMHGLGKALPRGDWVLVPFFLDVFVGMPMRFAGDRAAFMADYRARMDALRADGSFAPWD